MSGFGERPTITIQELFQRWGDWIEEQEGPGDVEAGWARLASAYDDGRRSRRMERIEALATIFGTAGLFGLFAFGFGWVTVRGWRRRR